MCATTLPRANNDRIFALTTHKRLFSYVQEAKTGSGGTGGMFADLLHTSAFLWLGQNS